MARSVWSRLSAGLSAFRGRCAFPDKTGQGDLVERSKEEMERPPPSFSKRAPGEKRRDRR